MIKKAPYRRHGNYSSFTRDVVILVQEPAGNIALIAASVLTPKTPSYPEWVMDGSTIATITVERRRLRSMPSHTSEGGLSENAP